MFNQAVDFTRINQAMCGVAETSKQLEQVIKSGTISFEAFSELLHKEEPAKGNKRNGTLDRKQAFGGLFPKYRRS